MFFYKKKPDVPPFWCQEDNEREITKKIMQARVMILVHDTSSDGALQMCKVLS